MQVDVLMKSVYIHAVEVNVPWVMSQPDNLIHGRGMSMNMFTYIHMQYDL